MIKTTTPINTQNLSTQSQIALDLMDELCLDFMIDDIRFSTGIPVANVSFSNEGEVVHFMVNLSNEKHNLCYTFTNCDDVSEDIEEFELEIFNPITEEWDYHYCEDIDQVDALL